jgi:hypothetical protein
MKRFLSWFHRPSRRQPAAAHRRRPARPQLEQLDDRLVPSTTGPSSAISISSSFYYQGIRFPYTERDWYTIDRSTEQVVEFRDTTRYNLGGPGAIVKVSASVDPQTGHGGVFALDDFGTIWWFNSLGQWSHLPGSYRDMCATDDGHVYAVTSNGSDVHYLSSNGSATDLGTPPAGVLLGYSSNALAASTGLGGKNEVFAIGQNGAIYVNDSNALGQWSLVDNSQVFEGLSAARNNTLFATTQSGKLYEETEQQLWIWEGLYGLHEVFFWSGQNISGGNLYGRISADTDASGAAEVYAISPQTRDAYRYDQGSWALLIADTTFEDISGADGGYFYAVNDLLLYNHYDGWQYNPQILNPWTYLGSNLL